MQAICTKYIGPTNFKGSRIKAYCESGLSVTIPNPDKELMEDSHRVAVAVFLEKFGWPGTALEWRPGATKSGWAWVFSPRFVVLLQAPQDINGNPRRLWLAFAEEQELVGVYQAEYKNCPKELPPSTSSRAVNIQATLADYRDWIATAKELGIYHA